MKSPTNVVKQAYEIDVSSREKLINQKGLVLWFTGLSGSGKSTLANAIETQLHQNKKHTFLLDGDNLRHGLNRDLGFSNIDRKENIRRVAHVANLMADSGLIVLSAFVSPFRSDRLKASKIIGENRFIEIFVDCPLSICELRDVKGLYSKARQGIISDFTGISSPFETPINPTIKVETNTMDLKACTNKIISFISQYHV
jgi:adenylyl-sulfate kinase